MPVQIWDMIEWSGILVVGISTVGFWVQRIISFLTEDTEKMKEPEKMKEIKKEK